MRPLLLTLDVLQLLDNARSDQGDKMVLASEMIAQCQDLIAKHAGYTSRSEWSAELMSRGNQREALEACKADLEREEYEIIVSGRTAFMVLVKNPEDISGLLRIIAHYPGLDSWADPETDEEVYVVSTV